MDPWLLIWEGYADLEAVMADRKERYERKQSAKERRQQQSRNARRGNLGPFGLH